MMGGMKRWLDKERNRMRKTAGLAEKDASIKHKLDVAMAILQDQRKRDKPVIMDRRLNGHAA